MVGAIVALVLGGAAVAAVSIDGGREWVSYPPGSPEAALQRYASAWEAGDTATAWDAFTPGSRNRLSRREFQEANDWRGSERHRVWVDERSGTGERVTLHLSVETIYGNGLVGLARYTLRTRVTFVRQDDQWKIDTPLVGYQRR